MNRGGLFVKRTGRSARAGLRHRRRPMRRVRFFPGMHGIQYTLTCNSILPNM